MLVGVIAVFGKLYLDPARREEALGEFHLVVADTIKEPGCHAYVVSADLADPCTLYIFEEWTDSDALEAHQRSEHFVAHRERSAGHLTAAEISHYEVTSVDRRTMGSPPAAPA
jgi:quinol monooxygenase YgiN